ncbi:MAG TPA: hypothetical protein VK864_13250, partial [Longimicrobiales bacterium]|nr:hypothetical protein [Longimicrobiales bacterium]
YRTLLRRDTRARLATARLIGEPAVDLAPGSAGSPMLAPGDTIYASRIRPAKQLQASWAELRTVVDSLRADAQPLQPVLAERRAEWAAIALSIEQLHAEFARTRRGLGQGSAAGLFSDATLGASLARMSETAEQLGPALDAVSSRYSDPALQKTIERLGHRTGKLAKQLHRLSDQLANGSLPRFASDSAIQKAVHRAQADLDSLIAETKRNPLRYWLGNPGK